MKRKTWGKRLLSMVLALTMMIAIGNVPVVYAAEDTSTTNNYSWTFTSDADLDGWGWSSSSTTTAGIEGGALKITQESAPGSTVWYGHSLSGLNGEIEVNADLSFKLAPYTSTGNTAQGFFVLADATDNPIMQLVVANGSNVGNYFRVFLDFGNGKATDIIAPTLKLSPHDKDTPIDVHLKAILDTKAETISASITYKGVEYSANAAWRTKRVKIEKIRFAAQGKTVPAELKYDNITIRNTTAYILNAEHCSSNVRGLYEVKLSYQGAPANGFVTNLNIPKGFYLCDTNGNVATPEGEGQDVSSVIASSDAGLTVQGSLTDSVLTLNGVPNDALEHGNTDSPTEIFTFYLVKDDEAAGETPHITPATTDKNGNAYPIYAIFGEGEGVTISEVSLAAYDDKLAHTLASEWSKDETGHWHACANCTEKNDFAAHIPGAAATEDTPQTCTECGYVIAPATGHIDHSNRTLVPGKAATCAEAGWNDYYKCNKCDKLFTEETGGTEITDIEAWKVGDGKVTVPHSWASEWSNNESKHWHECSVCHDKNDEAAHTPGAAATEDTPQTCTECGYVIAPATGHIDHSNRTLVPGKAATCAEAGWNDYYKCNKCDKLFTAATGGTEITDIEAWKVGDGKVTVPHSWASEWSNNESKHWHECSVCHDKNDEAAHTPGAAATEDTPQTCTECGYVIAPATGHINHSNRTLVPGKAATCTVDGWKDYYKCNGCDKYFTAATGDNEIPDLEAWKLGAGKIVALGHTYGNDNKCTVCGATKPSYGGGGSYIPPVQKPVIDNNNNAKTELSGDGTKLTIKAEEGYKVVDVIVNGVSKGAVDTLTGLKTGDKVVVVTEEIEIEPTIEEVKAELGTSSLVARSQAVTLKNGKKAIKITWYDQNGNEVKYDGVEIYRSTKRNTGYGKKPIYVSKSGVYYNTSIKPGTKYYYRVRGFREIDGQKYYTNWSLKAFRAW